jgi:hypothetical protein
VPLQHFPLHDRKEFLAWLEKYQPDVVIGFNALVYWWLRDAGRRVPEDVGCISLMLDLGPVTDRHVCGVETDWVSIGRIAIEQLDILLRTNRSGIPERPVTVAVPGIWHEGITLRSATAAPAGRHPSPG